MKRWFAALLLLAACSGDTEPRGPIADSDSRNRHITRHVAWVTFIDPEYGTEVRCLLVSTPGYYGITSWCGEVDR